MDLIPPKKKGKRKKDAKIKSRAKSSFTIIQSTHLWPITNRITIPFSSSSFFLLSPDFHIIKEVRIDQIQSKIRKTKSNKCGQPIHIPWGIQVARTESLRLRLLKAVLTPTTIKYFLFLLDPEILRSSDMGEPLSIDTCAALAAANSISKFEIVLSKVLHYECSHKNKFSAVHRKLDAPIFKITHCIALWVLETSPRMSLDSCFTSF